MQSFRPFRFVLAVLLAASSAKLFALELLIVDQSGTPLANTYVAIPSGQIEPSEKTPAVMDQVDVQFVPHVLAIEQGQSVVFPNSDNIRHHVYSFSEPKRFEIKLYQGVPNQPIGFDKPGLVALGCNIHDSMLGYIMVSPWPSYTVTDKSGQATFDQTTKEIAIWHPWLKGKTAPMQIDISSLIENNKATITLQVTKPTPRKSLKNTRRRYDD